MNECPFVDEDCPNKCGKQLQRKDLQRHMEKDCPLRRVPCKYCKELELWNAVEVCVKFFIITIWVFRVINIKSLRTITLPCEKGNS